MISQASVWSQSWTRLKVCYFPPFPEAAAMVPVPSSPDAGPGTAGGWRMLAERAGGSNSVTTRSCHLLLVLVPAGASCQPRPHVPLWVSCTSGHTRGKQASLLTWTPTPARAAPAWATRINHLFLPSQVRPWRRGNGQSWALITAADNGPFQPPSSISVSSCHLLFAPHSRKQTSGFIIKSNKSVLLQTRVCCSPPEKIPALYFS